MPQTRSLSLLVAAFALSAGCVSQPTEITPTGDGQPLPTRSVTPPSPQPPPTTPAEVAEQFHAAVASGNRAAAARLASPAAVAVFEPYRSMFDLVLSAPVGGTFGLVADGESFRCTLVDLSVTECAVDLGGEDPLAAGQYARYERLSPDPGGVALTVTGPTATGPEAFAVEALGGGGKLLDVSVVGGTFVVYEPTGVVAVGDATETSLELSTTGTYLVVVTPTDPAGYTLGVGVSVPAD